MSDNKEVLAEGVLETDPLPFEKNEAGQEQVNIEIKDSASDDPKPEEDEGRAKPEDTQEPIEIENKPDNVESEDALPWQKKEEDAAEAAAIEKEIETEVSEIEINSEEIFDSTLLNAEEPANNEPGAQEEPVINEFLEPFLVEVKEVAGIELPKDPKEAAKAINLAIQGAKQLVEIDTSKYSEEQLALHNHLKSEKGLQEFADITAPFVNFLAKPEEEKVRLYLVHEKGIKDESEIQEEIDRLIEKDEWDKTVGEINSGMIALRDQTVNDRISKLAIDYKKLSESDNQIVERERNEMIAVVDEMTEFMGVKIPDAFKNTLKSEIHSGKITQMNNNAKTQIQARLYDLVGHTITERNKAFIQKIKDEAYNRGVEKGRGSLHNTPIKQESLGREKPEFPGEQTNRGFADIDKDAKTT